MINMVNMMALSISLKEIGENLLMLLIGGVVIVVGIKIAINLAKKAIAFIAIAAVAGLCIFGYTVINPKDDTAVVQEDADYDEDVDTDAEYDYEETPVEENAEIVEY